MLHSKFPFDLDTEMKKLQKTLDDLTPEMRAKLPEYRAKVTTPIFNGDKYYGMKYENVESCVRMNYENCDQKQPNVIYVVENPYEMTIIQQYMTANEAEFDYILNDPTNQHEKLREHLDRTIMKDVREGKVDIPKYIEKYHATYIYTMNIYSQVYYQWYCYLRDMFNLKDDLKVDPYFTEIFESHDKSRIYSCSLHEKIAIICKYPKTVHQDPVTMALHNTKGCSVEWGYEFCPYEHYNVNDREVSPELFKSVLDKSMTFEKFNALKNEDDRAMVISIIKENDGPQGLLNFLQATLVHETDVEHANGYKEKMRLYRTKKNFGFANDRNGRQNVPLAWLELTCPSTGATYMLDCCPSFDNAVEAAAFLRPESVPEELPYIWQSAN